MNNIVRKESADLKQVISGMIIVLLCAVSISFPVQAAGGTGFKDVSVSVYYAKAVSWALDNGITKGYADYTFHPEGTCTRREMTIMVWRMAGCPKCSYEAEHIFSDMNAYKHTTDTWKAVSWAGENNIVTVFDGETFGPDADVTRNDVIATIYRLYLHEHPVNEDEESDDKEEADDIIVFSDVTTKDFPSSNIIFQSVSWAFENGITKGYPDGSFRPFASVSRADLVTFLYRFSGSPSVKVREPADYTMIEKLNMAKGKPGNLDYMPKLIYNTRTAFPQVDIAYTGAGTPLYLGMSAFWPVYNHKMVNWGSSWHCYASVNGNSYKPQAGDIVLFYRKGSELPSVQAVGHVAIIIEDYDLQTGKYYTFDGSSVPYKGDHVTIREHIFGKANAAGLVESVIWHNDNENIRQMILNGVMTVQREYIYDKNKYLSAMDNMTHHEEYGSWCWINVLHVLQNAK